MLRQVLPRDVRADDESDLICPWCKLDACDATVTLEGLFVAQQSGELGFAHRDAGDTPDPRALVAACPHCERPFMVTVRDGEVRLLAVRTPADARLLEGAA